MGILRCAEGIQREYRVCAEGILRCAEGILRCAEGILRCAESLLIGN